jgi:hypothetical protein
VDADRFSFTYEEAASLAETLGYSNAAPVIRSLKGYGLTMAERKPEKTVRGFHSNSHDRWSGPGSSSCHGGSGWQQISGFAGDEG